MNNRIVNCEREYSKCFSVSSQNGDITRFYDDTLKDMYYHNFTYIRNGRAKVNLLEIIKEEIFKSQTQGSDFCNILIDVEHNQLPSLILDNTADITINGFYSFDISTILKLKTIDGASIEQVTGKNRLEDVLYCDLQIDEIALGKDFCTRRCYRRGEVYLSESGVNSYVCYYKGVIIGSCDLFIHNKVAKIENFTVVAQYQRKGFGTTILKHLIHLALNNECNLIYLVTDDEDTAKEMYKKLYFNKVGERTDLFFKLAQ